MIFRVVLLIYLYTILNPSAANAQRVLYFGVESGFASNTYFYTNNIGHRLNKTNVNATVGFVVGHSINNWFFESGAYGIYSNSPYFIFNVDNNTLTPKENSEGAVMDLVYLPIRAGYMIPILKGKIKITPKMGVGLMHSLNGAGRVYTWAHGVADLSLIVSGNFPEDPGVSVGYGYQPYTNSMAFDASIALSYKLHKFLQLNFNVRVLSPLKPLYFENIKHFGETYTVYATSTQVGPVISANLGFAFAIPFATTQVEVE
jgi:hypothetical protein